MPAGTVELERMLAVIDADYRSLEKQLRKTNAIFDGECKKLEKRQAGLFQKLSLAKFTGFDAVKSAAIGLTAGAIVTGISSLVNKGLEAAAAIGDVAKQSGFAVERVQTLRFAASQTGSSFKELDEAIITFGRNFGEFLNSGGGKGADAFKALGLDKLINSGQIRTVEQGFDAYLAKVREVQNEQQRGAYLSKAFGQEIGPKMVEMVGLGVAGLQALEDQARSLGIVLDTKTVAGAKDAKDKLDALFNVMEAQGTAAVAALAPQIAALAQNITDGLPSLIRWVEKWSEYFGLINLDPVQKLRIQLADAQKELDGLLQQKENNTWWKSLFGTSNREFDVFIDAALAKITGLSKKLANAEATAPAPAAAAAVTLPTLKVNDKEAEARAKAEAARLEALNQRRDEIMAQSKVDMATANAALVAAQNQNAIQLLTGQVGLQQAIRKQIQDEYQARIDVIDAEAAKQIEALDKVKKGWAEYGQAVANVQAVADAKKATADQERQRALDESGSGRFMRDAATDAQELVRQYQYEAAALGLVGGAAARFAFLQGKLNDAKRAGITLTAEEIAALKAQADAVGVAAQRTEDAAEVTDRQIQMTDGLRRGLLDVGKAGLKGFGSLADAAANALEQIGEMAFEIYAMKPLLDMLFGKDRTAGGGFIGALLGSIPGFAGGTNGAPGGLAWVGERGPELVNLPKGSQVIPNDLIRSASAARVSGALRGGSGPTLLQQINLSGAVVTDELMERVDRRAHQAAGTVVAEFNRRVLPTRVSQLVNDPRRK